MYIPRPYGQACRVLIPASDKNTPFTRRGSQNKRNKTTPFAWALALQSSIRNRSPASDLVFWKLMFQRVWLSRGMFFVQRHRQDHVNPYIRARRVRRGKGRPTPPDCNGAPNCRLEDWSAERRTWILHRSVHYYRSIPDHDAVMTTWDIYTCDPQPKTCSLLEPWILSKTETLKRLP